MATIQKRPKNGHLQGIFKDIFICAKPELSPFGTIFAFGADNVEEQRLGTVFGIIKIDDHSEDSSYVANLLTSVIKKEYFGKPQRGAEESFEAALRKANLALAELARHGALNWTGKLNFVGGALEKNNLHFVCLGNVSVFLLRGGQIAEISKDFQDELGSETHPLKTFSDISSGKLEKGDKLVFTSHDLLEVFSREELKHNAAHFSREEFPRFLEMSLEANAELAGIIVIDIVDELETKPVIESQPIRHHEIAPTITDVAAVPPKEKPAENIMDATFADVGGPGRMSSSTDTIVETEDFQKETFWDKFLEISKSASSSSAQFIRKLFFRFSSSLKSARLGEKIKSIEVKKSVSKLSAFGRRISGLFLRLARSFVLLEPKKKKIILGVIGAIVVVALGAAAISSRNNKTAPAASETPAAPVAAKPALALDDTAAKAIENIETVAGLSKENTRFAMLDGALYAISGNDRTVTKISPDSKSVEEIKSNLSSGNFGLITAMPHLNSLFLLTDQKEVIDLTPANKNFTANNISLPANLTARDIRSYLTYLYVLDIGDNQILRYPRAEGGFGEMQSWLREQVDLKNTKGIAVNDDLYLAGPSDIAAYLQGKKDSAVNFESPQTPLAIDAIFSDSGLNSIWVLDNTNHRVIEFTKDGKISAQYFSEQIDGIHDILADEQNKTVYLLAGSSVLKFSTE